MMVISLETYTLLQKFKAEHTELYWRLFVIYLDWYSAEHRYGCGGIHDESLRDFWITRSNEFYRVQGGLAPKSDSRFFLAPWREGVI